MSSRLTQTPTQSPIDALRDCPFCGSPALLEHDSDRHGEWFNLGCSKHWEDVGDDEPSCPGGRLWYTASPDEEAEAIAAWNRRAYIAGQEAAAPSEEPVAAHSDDAAVDRFAAAMKAKLAKKREEGRGGWDGPSCTAQFLSDLLRGHVDKGDPVDVGNLAMMLHQRGERII